MKIPFLLVPLVGGALLCAGCFSMATASSDSFSHARRQNTPGAPREHVVVANYGWFLFNKWPIVCGNAREGARFPWTFFRNEVTSDIVNDRLTSYAAAKGADLTDVNLFYTDNVLFQISVMGVQIPIPYVLCYHERLVSGLLVERPPAPKADAPAHRKVDHALKRRRELEKLLDSIPDGGVK